MVGSVGTRTKSFERRGYRAVPPGRSRETNDATRFRIDHRPYEPERSPDNLSSSQTAPETDVAVSAPALQVPSPVTKASVVKAVRFHWEGSATGQDLRPSSHPNRYPPPAAHDSGVPRSIPAKIRNEVQPARVTGRHCQHPRKQRQAVAIAEASIDAVRFEAPKGKGAPFEFVRS